VVAGGALSLFQGSTTTVPAPAIALYRQAAFTARLAPWSPHSEMISVKFSVAMTLFSGFPRVLSVLFFIQNEMKYFF
jgi:hypothetical protein